MSTSLATDVTRLLPGLEHQIGGFGWDNGVGLWAIHAQHDDSGDLLFEKLGGPDYPHVNPIDLLRTVPPPPACYCGIVVSYEAWTQDPTWTVGVGDPPRIDVRYVIAVLRSQTAVVIERVRDRKPMVRVAPADRPMAGNESCLTIVSILRNLLTQTMTMPEIHVVQIDGDTLRRLFGGE